MVNRVIIGGRLCSDPELKATQQGTSVVSFTIACDRDFKNAQGEKEADFVSIVAWRSTAEFISRNFSKGRMIVVDGRLQIRQYADKDNNKRYAAEVVAESVYFGDSKKDTDAGTAAQADTSAAGEAKFTELDNDGELPF